MPTLETTIEAFLASREFDQATVSRCAFWSEQFGHKQLAEITDDDVDAALVRLAERGRLKPRRGKEKAKAGKPLSGASINRYITQLGSLYKYAKRLRLLPRSFVAPTMGIEKYPEKADPERYLRTEQVERLIKVARLLDTKWGKLEALILFAYHTGLRVGNLMEITWRDVDLEAKTVRVTCTKNGDPIISPLSSRLVKALDKLTGEDLDNLVFAGKFGQPYSWRRIWNKVCKEAGLEGRNFHQLRHGCGHALASSGANQANHGRYGP